MLLIGVGAAHTQLLRAWAKQPLAGVQITLIAAQTHSWYTPRLAGFLAGHWVAEECQWPLEPLVQRSAVQWVRASLRSLNANARTAVLDDGRTLKFDWLSINVPGDQNRDVADTYMPGAREHALFVHPLVAFCTLWPQVLGMAQTRPLRFTVVGAGATGCEIAMALQHRVPQARVTLLSGPQAPLAHRIPALQARVLQVLKKRNITVLQDCALGVTAKTVQLGCGAHLASDVTLIATGQQLPRWLADSGLAQDGSGRLVLDDFQRSSSHPSVFISGMPGNLGPNAQQGQLAIAAGDDLARNLAASVMGKPVTAKSTLGSSASTGTSSRTSAGWQVLDCGNRSALASGRGFIFQGAWVWWLVRWRDQRWLKPLQHEGVVPSGTP